MTRKGLTATAITGGMIMITGVITALPVTADRLIAMVLLRDVIMSGKKK